MAVVDHLRCLPISRQWKLLTKALSRTVLLQFVIKYEACKSMNPTIVDWLLYGCIVFWSKGLFITAIITKLAI